MADLAENLKPSFVSNIKDVWDTEIIKFENKAEQRFANDHVGETHYEIGWSLLSPDLLVDLRNFFNAKAGQLRKWTINDSRIGAGDVLVRFTVDELDIVPVKHRAYNVKAKVKTCSY